MSTPPQILIVDDHAVVRAGLVRILTTTGAGWQCHECGDGFSALAFIRKHPVDLVVTDLSMPQMSGLDFIRRCREEFPRTRVLVLSMHAEEQYALRAFQAGAHGYVTKDRAADELVAAITKVLSGGIFVTASLAEQVVGQLNGSMARPMHSLLSDRELEVFKRIIAGERLTDIADALHLSIKTVSTYKRNIQDKLQLSSTAALVRYGLEQGLNSDG